MELQQFLPYRLAVLADAVSRSMSAVYRQRFELSRDEWRLLAALSAWMGSAGKELLEEADLIVPVPLHYFRLVRRGFNQWGWLAAALSKSSGVRLSVDALKRARATPIQGGLSADGRRRNV